MKKIQKKLMFNQCCIAPCKVIQESRIRLLIALQSGIQTVQYRIQTSEESRILILGQFSGIRNPRPIWNPSNGIRNPRSGIQGAESGIQREESGIQDQGVESGIQGVHGLPYMGRFVNRIKIFLIYINFSI